MDEPVCSNTKKELKVLRKRVLKRMEEKSLNGEDIKHEEKLLAEIAECVAYKLNNGLR